MRILLLCHSFNSLTQRLFVELSDAGHELSVEFDINDAVTSEAVELYRPDLVLCPYLRRRIAERVWRRHRCIILHPGIKGDRGPSALDWAVFEAPERWGVTALQAAEVLDAGDIWATAEFPLRRARKSSIYRHEVTDAAVEVVDALLGRLARADSRPEPLDYLRGDVIGRARPRMRQADRAIDWQADEMQTVLRKINTGDGSPGVRDRIFDRTVYLYDAHAETRLRGEPGQLIARRHGALCRATVDGAVWIGQLRTRQQGRRGIKLPASLALEQARTVPEVAVSPDLGAQDSTFNEIRYREHGALGLLTFDFYNGAMSTEQCQRLLSAYREACQRPTRVLLLLGGEDFWSNGMHLNVIEQAESPADESWLNINAIDDLALEMINTMDRLTIAALRGNAAAGGVFLALAADLVWARSGVVLNPHYKAMGNLYGSEYWTYLLPRRVGPRRAAELTEQRLPLSARRALSLGLIDDCFAVASASFEREVIARAETLASDAALPLRLEQKRRQRAAAEAERSLAAYREAELERMKLNFYGFDSSYHVARYNFVHRVPHSRTPLHLAKHRQH